jgi:glycosyltransferase involved in cell wall biosynthesis
MSVPIIATDRVASAYDLIEDGGSGFVVKSGDVDALACRLVEILQDKSIQSRFALKAREMFELYHQEHVIAHRLLEAAGHRSAVVVQEA